MSVFSYGLVKGSSVLHLKIHSEHFDHNCNLYIIFRVKGSSLLRFKIYIDHNCNFYIIFRLNQIVYWESTSCFTIINNLGTSEVIWVVLGKSRTYKLDINPRPSFPLFSTIPVPLYKHLSKIMVALN